jgi:site-specific DNA recombinase
MEAELLEKESEHAIVSSEYKPLHIEHTQLQLIQHEMKTMIGLLDDEVPNPELLNQHVSKYISRVIVQRETKTVVITSQIKYNDILLYQKTIVADWDLF